jgi:hypothetical protein
MKAGCRKLDVWFERRTEASPSVGASSDPAAMKALERRGCQEVRARLAGRAHSPAAASRSCPTHDAATARTDSS